MRNIILLARAGNCTPRAIMDSSSSCTTHLLLKICTTVSDGQNKLYLRFPCFTSAHLLSIHLKLSVQLQYHHDVFKLNNSNSTGVFLRLQHRAHKCIFRGSSSQVNFPSPHMNAIHGSLLRVTDGIFSEAQLVQKAVFSRANMVQHGSGQERKCRKVYSRPFNDIRNQTQ